MSVSEARESIISFSSNFVTCWDGRRFFMRWSVDILLERMRTLLIEIPPATA